MFKRKKIDKRKKAFLKAFILKKPLYYSFYSLHSCECLPISKLIIRPSLLLEGKTIHLHPDRVSTSLL